MNPFDTDPARTRARDIWSSFALEPVAADTPEAARARIDVLIESLYRAGGVPDAIYVSPHTATQLAKLNSSYLRASTPAPSIPSNTIQIYESPFGICRIIPSDTSTL